MPYRSHAQTSRFDQERLLIDLYSNLYITWIGVAGARQEGELFGPTATSESDRDRHHAFCTWYKPIYTRVWTGFGSSFNLMRLRL